MLSLEKDYTEITLTKLIYLLYSIW